jgi:tellurite resistance protein TerC
MPETSLATWLALAIILAVAIIADLGIFRRRSNDVPLRVALAETAAWIGLSVAFGVWIFFSRGTRTGLEFFSAYVIEKALSVDNIFLFLIIFRSFNISPRAQHKVLYSGIVGALIFRALFVFGGIALLGRFHFVMYAFGALLVAVAVHMLFPRKDSTEGGWLVRFVCKVCPPAESNGDARFFMRAGGRWRVTSLLLALVAVEVADIVFAVDSVPAVLAITRDPFIAYSSNAFAILGLRAMYFGIAGILPRFRYLHQALAAILLFVGAKMLLSERLHVPEGVSLGVISGILVVAAAASWLVSRKAN